MNNLLVHFSCLGFWLKVFKYYIKFKLSYTFFKVLVQSQYFSPAAGIFIWIWLKIRGGRRLHR
jgi:hypothetical protein